MPPDAPPSPCGPYPLAILVTGCVAALAWSAWRPKAYDVWAFEIAAGVIGVGVLVATARRFRFSNLVYLLVGIHFLVLAVAAKYTYAEVPLFNWLRDALGLARNPFDRVGHFLQGFVPAAIAREVLLRRSPLRRGKLLAFIVVAICLAISAAWELLEWGMVVVFYPDAGPEWLGMQGDPWDTQEDMLMALLGATLAVTLLARLHDASLRALPGAAEPT